MADRTMIYELKLSEEQKYILALCQRERTMAEITGKLSIRSEKSIETIRRNIVPALVGIGYLNKIETPSKKIMYKTTRKIKFYEG